MITTILSIAKPKKNASASAVFVRRPPSSSAVRRPPSAVRRPPSAVRRPPSAVRRPPSAVRRPPSVSAVRRSRELASWFCDEWKRAFKRPEVQSLRGRPKKSLPASPGYPNIHSSLAIDIFSDECKLPSEIFQFEICFLVNFRCKSIHSLFSMTKKSKYHISQKGKYQLNDQFACVAK